jgi:hypothetical protein
MFTSANVKRKATSSISGAVSPSAPKKLKQGSLAAFFGSPSGGASKVHFDKEAWVKSLTPPQKELLK